MKKAHHFLAIIFLWLCGSAVNGDALSQAREASAALKTAAEQLQDADGASDRVAALGEAIKIYESGLLAMREGLRSVAIRERSLRAAFSSQRDQISRLLGVLLTLERATTPLLLIHPTGPVGTARSGMMLSEITPSLQTQAEALRVQLEELKNVEVTQRIAETDLQNGLDGLNAARAALSQAMASREELPKRLVEDPEKLQQIAQSSQSLEDFAKSLKEIADPNTAIAPITFDAALGTLQLPANGTVLRGFNEKDAAGLARTGLLLATPPLSLVSAPWSATVRFSGPFLDYGNVIILEPDPDYLIVLAGLGQNYVSVGEIVNKGDPIGIIGGNQLEINDLLLEVSQVGATLAQETLYLEIRKNKLPVDPIDWFALKKG